MTPTVILYVILSILAFDFFLERILDVLNLRNWTPELPIVLEGIYDQEKYKKSQDYQRAKYKLSFLSSTISFIGSFLMIVLGGFAWVDELARQFTDHPILIALLFFGVIMLASSIVGMPFTYYSTFVIEEKYGFNRTTIKTFILDRIKGGILGIIIGGGLLALLIWIYLQTTDNFWWMAWSVLAGFMIFMTMFYSSVIVPFFNKQTPLEDGELKSAIEEFANKADFKLDNVFVMDGSKRSSKGNAYFSGLGAKKRIVLFDTLINELTTEEIVAVLAHEIGHYQKKHTLSGIALSLMQTGLMFYIFSIFIGNPALSEALGSEVHGFHLGLIAFGILYSPISTILGLIMNVWSRHNEYQADEFADVNYNGKALGDALIKLSISSLSNLTPHKAYVFFYYSHPTLLQRLKAINYKKES
ncbi:M48 family metalloprotease [Marinifilum sp. N1E240]|uniref:M48 family metallopeptidase n=1 Tax=Marinifilum sp. N1E240 TaxID=2608082 RepID=UPI00128E8830|nr:M48 family metallopeptidase [Marinifilum sp. N1E240]MPQ48311.1 M48 family metalloprotease [Marinifilum sp. N1E240]